MAAWLGEMRTWFLRVVVLAVLLLLLIAAAVALRAASTASGPTSHQPEAGEGQSALLTARGRVRPVAHARVGTLVGGVVVRLTAAPGDLVVEQQELARVRGPNGTEVVTAPIHGAVLDVLVEVGDTLLPGATVATLGDLSRLKVETTDVDEFVIGSVRPGQLVQLHIDALGRDLGGLVRSVALEPRTTPAGDEHYLVIIDLLEQAPELRVGMTARITFRE